MGVREYLKNKMLVKTQGQTVLQNKLMTVEYRGLNGNNTFLKNIYSSLKSK